MSITFQVKLGEPGYKERYYSEKFGVSTAEDIHEVRQDVVSSITEYGLLLLHFFHNLFILYSVGLLVSISG